MGGEQLRKFVIMLILLNNRLISISEESLRKAEKDAGKARRLKIAIAREFRLPTWKHVNLRKAFEYLQWRESSAGKLESFLDGVADEHRREIVGA